MNEPHCAVCCDVQAAVLNLVAEESEQAHQHSVELASTPDRETLRLVERVPTLILPERHLVDSSDINPRYIQRILLRTYEAAPQTDEELLRAKGVGAKTLRALALVSELIYGTRASTRDPARFSFAHGGKDGTPYPVDQEAHDRTIEVLNAALKPLKRTRIERSKKSRP